MLQQETVDFQPNQNFLVPARFQWLYEKKSQPGKLDMEKMPAHEVSQSREWLKTSVLTKKIYGLVNRTIKK